MFSTKLDLFFKESYMHLSFLLNNDTLWRSIWVWRQRCCWLSGLPMNLSINSIGEILCTSARKRTRGDEEKGRWSTEELWCILCLCTNSPNECNHYAMHQCQNKIKCWKVSMLKVKVKSITVKGTQLVRILLRKLPLTMNTHPTVPASFWSSSWSPLSRCLYEVWSKTQWMLLPSTTQATS